MRVTASMTRLVSKLRSRNWPEEQIRALLANVPAEIIDQLLATSRPHQISPEPAEVRTVPCHPSGAGFLSYAYGHLARLEAEEKAQRTSLLKATLHLAAVPSQDRQRIEAEMASLPAGTSAEGFVRQLTSMVASPDAIARYASDLDATIAGCLRLITRLRQALGGAR